MVFDIRKLASAGYNIRNCFTDNSVATAKMPCHVDKRTLVPSAIAYKSKSNEWFRNQLVIHESCGYGIKCGRQDTKDNRYIVCLDFDIYVKETGLDCPIAKREFGLYNDRCGSEDGMYESSTDGNYNVLCDITNCAKLIEMCDGLPEFFHPVGGGLEFQVTKHQVIPPTMTPCKKSGKMDRRREFSDDDAPFKVVEDFDNVYMMLFKYLEAGQKYRKSPTRVITPTSSDSELVPPDAKYIDMVMNGIGNKLQRGQYLKLATVLKSNGYSYAIWDKWCVDVYGATDADHERVWEDAIVGPDEHMTLLEGLSKQYNPTYHADFCRARTAEMKLDKTAVNEICQQLKADEKPIVELSITMNELIDVNLCADVITKTLIHTLCFTGDSWCELDNNNLWRMTKDPTYKITKTVRAYIDYSNGLITQKIQLESDEDKKQKLRDTSASFCGQYIAINKTSWNSVLQKSLKTTLYDAEFVNKLNQNAGYLVFKNGVVNMETGKFREGIRGDDFVTRTIPYDYSTCDSTKKLWLLEKLKQILNNDTNDLEYFLCWLGYSFIGKAHLEKAMLFMIDGTDTGKGNNGKTLIFDVLLSILPNYVYKSSGTMLEDGNTKVHKQLALLDGIRVLFLEEFSKTKRLNTELMKELSDGKTKENEVMFGTMKKINILFKTFVLSNHQITVGEGNEAVYNRWIQMKFGSHFGLIDDAESLEFPIDRSLSDTIKDDYKYEMIAIILEYSMKYFVSGMPKQTEKVVQALNEQKRSQSEMLDWLEQNCVKGKEFRLSHAMLLATNTVCGNEKELKNKMKEMGYKYQSNLQGFGKNSDGSYIMGGYAGLKMLE